MINFSLFRQDIFNYSVIPLAVLGSLTLFTPKSSAITITDFSDVYAPSYWRTDNSPTATGNAIQGTTSLEIRLDSGNTGDYFERLIDIDVSRAGDLQFSWSFNSQEVAGIHSAGYILNGVYQSQVTSTGETDGNGDPITIISTTPVTVSVKDGDTFGFRFLAEANTNSSGIYTVNNFSATTATPVPFETDTLPLIGSTVLFGIGIWAKGKLVNKK
ncbi:MAG: hypothetical protein ACKO2V_07580 [Snowella sp.]